MTRIEEAKLAFVGTAEVECRPYLARDFVADSHFQSLLASGMIEQDGDHLICTMAGWRFLDRRPKDDR